MKSVAPGAPPGALFDQFQNWAISNDGQNTANALDGISHGAAAVGVVLDLFGITAPAGVGFEIASIAASAASTAISCSAFLTGTGCLNGMLVAIGPDVPD